MTTTITEDFNDLTYTGCANSTLQHKYNWVASRRQPYQNPAIANLCLQACRIGRCVLRSTACLTAGMHLLTDQQESASFTLSQNSLQQNWHQNMTADSDIHEMQTQLHATKQILYSLISI